MFDNKYLSSESVKMAEHPLHEAPVVRLANGNDCTPQHFFAFDHTLNSVECLISKVEFSPQYPIFVSCDSGGVFLQAGVIGYDNYQSHSPLQPKKIVYGRKWRVESNLPTSEIIQTTFLAIKKAREHELREFVSLYDPLSGKRSTPFNCHHDLPLMASNAELFIHSSSAIEPFLNDEKMLPLLNKIRVGSRKITLMDFTKRAHNTIIDLTISEPDKSDDHGELSEFNNLSLTLVLKELNVNEFLHELMVELINISDRFVEEHFLFDGFARFSRQQDIISIGQFSINTRHIEDENFNEDSKAVFRQHNGMIDATRVPVIFNEAQRKRLEAVLL